MRRDIQATESHKTRTAVRSDAQLEALRAMTPQQAADWVDTNVTDMASAKQVLKLMAKVLVYTLKQV